MKKTWKDRYCASVAVSVVTLTIAWTSAEAQDITIKNGPGKQIVIINGLPQGPAAKPAPVKVCQQKQVSEITVAPTVVYIERPPIARFYRGGVQGQMPPGLVPGYRQPEPLPWYYLYSECW